MIVTVCLCLKKMGSLHQLLKAHIKERGGVLMMNNGQIIIASGRLLVV